MNQKGGLVSNQMSDRSIIDALNEAFNMNNDNGNKDDDTVKFNESTRSLIIKNVDKNVQKMNNTLTPQRAVAFSLPNSIPSQECSNTWNLL